MRIIAGRHRGRRLQAPAGSGTRPTADRVREAIFSMVGSRLGELHGVEALDLFAGSGALGLEALSRGARAVVFVDRDRACARVIEANLAALGEGAAGAVVCATVARALRDLAAAGRSFGLVLADPPYAEDPGEAARLISSGRVLAPGGLLVLEHRAEADPLAGGGGGLTLLAGRRYGDSAVSLLAPAAGH